MKTPIMLGGVAALIFLVVDLIWLSIAAKSVYQAEIGPLLRKEFNLVAAAAFYTIFIAGLTLFVLMPAFTRESVLYAAMMGAAFGLVTYATYDLTNLATLEGFTLRIALIDMAWGTTLSAIVSAGAVAAILRFAPQP